MGWEFWRRSWTEMRGFGRRVLALVFAASLAACGYADQLSGHSLEYNAQAETIKNQTLLVNVLRAAYRRPLQFTDLSTISAQLSVSGTAALNLPFAGPANGNAELFQANPSITVTNSPTYTVAVLNTKEFYQGILAPIPMETVSYYLDVGFPKHLLLTLLLSEIEYGPPGATRRVYNQPIARRNRGEERIAIRFPELLDELIKMGLTVEQRPTKIGAPFGRRDYPKAKEVAELDAKGIEIASLGSSRYQLQKAGGSPRFCFDPTLADPATRVYAGMPLGIAGETLPGALLCGAKPDTGAPDRVFVLHTHSTEGVIYYLGELARSQLHLIPPQPGDWDPGVFYLREGPGAPGAITTTYEGKDYHIDVDPTGADRSSQALDLVSELLAQNNSAKDLPQPSVIPIAR